MKGLRTADNAEVPTEAQSVAGRMVELWATHRVDLVPGLFVPDAVVDYPDEGIKITGTLAIARQYAATTALNSALRLDQLSPDGDGRFLASYTVTIAPPGDASRRETLLRQDQTA